jgi:flagellar assembly protein FliH
MRRFLFETSFDEGQRAAPSPRAPEAAAAPAAPPAPAFTAEDIAAARALGHAEGELAGRTTAAADGDRRLATALEALGPQLQAALEARRQADEAVAKGAVELAMTVVRKMLPEAARRKGLAEIEAVVAECLATMAEEPRVVVRVADSQLDPMRLRVGEVTRTLGYDGAVVLLADPAMGPSDVRVDWADGGAERLTAHLWEEIDAILARHFARGTPHEPPPAQPEPASADPAGHVDVAS